MSRSKYKVPYTDNLGSYLSPRETCFYVIDDHIADVTTVYYPNGDTAFSWSTDDEESAKTLSKIISGEVNEDNAEPWNGKFDV